MRLFVVGALTACLVLSVGAAPATKPSKKRETVDRVAYPVLENAERQINHKLPIVGNMLGGEPEAAAGGAWISLTGETDRAKVIRNLCSDLRIGIADLDLATQGIAGSKHALASLTHGRISRVVLVFGSGFRYEDAERRMKDWSVQAVRADRTRDTNGMWGSIERDGTRYFARVIGRWEKQIPEKRRKIINRDGSVTEQVTPGYTDHGPTAIVFDVDVVGWWIAHKVRDDFKEAVRSGQVQAGMSENEARLAMIDYSPRIRREGSGEVIQWFRPTQRVSGVSANVSDDIVVLSGVGFAAGSSTTVTATIEHGEVLVGEASIERGAVVEYRRHE